MSLRAATFGELCPRFERCNASFCPGLGGKHLPGEAVCFWLREAVKGGGDARVRNTLKAELAEVVVDTAKRLLSEKGQLSRELRRASTSGSQIDSGLRLNRIREASQESCQGLLEGKHTGETGSTPCDGGGSRTASQSLHTEKGVLTHFG